VPRLGVALSNHFAPENFQGGEERGRSVALIVAGSALDVVMVMRFCIKDLRLLNGFGQIREVTSRSLLRAARPSVPF